MTNDQKERLPPARRFVFLAAPLFVLTLVGIGGAPAAAESTGVVAAECAGVWWVNFSPPLGLTGTTGTVTFQTSTSALSDGNLCSTQDLPCDSHQCLGLGEFPGTATGTYIGTCVHATATTSDGKLIHVFGGTVFAGAGVVNGVMWQLSGAIETKAPCTPGSGFGTFVVTAEAPSVNSPQTPDVEPDILTTIY